MVLTANCIAATSYGAMMAVVIERSSGGFISLDSVVDFGGEIKLWTMA
jgi:hypothetical protein